MKVPVAVVAAAAALAAALAVTRRPVRPPETTGTWLPAGRQPTRR